MKSPFPGMDPYIEASGLWEGFHGLLISKIAESLADVVPERYVVRPGERSYLVLVESQGKIDRPFIPDVTITTPRGRRKTTKKGGTALAEPAGEVEPVTMRAFIEEEHREAFVEIYEATAEQRLVTSVEVLSPSNKRPGTPGWDLYQRKRQSHLLGDVNLVEVDLLRGGQRMPMLDPWPKSPYTLLVARAKKPDLCKVWPAHFQRPFPTIPVPLARPDPDVSLSLQLLIEAIYQRFHYERSIDYTRPLNPPLRAKQAAWLAEQLRARPGIIQDASTDNKSQKGGPKVIPATCVQPADRLPCPAGELTRRRWLQCAATALVATVSGKADGAWADAPANRRCTLSFSTYATRGLTLERALAVIAGQGYDGVEIAVAPGFDAEPARMPPQRRRAVRQLLADRRLKLTSLMENLPPAADAARHRADLDRLRRVMELARDLAPDHPPLVQTVLGGGTWEEKQNLFRDRLGGWLAVAREARIMVAIKPHRGGAMSRPAEALWLIRQLQESPWLRMVYDYSHYAFRDMTLEETIRMSLPFTAHIAVKDAVQRQGRVQFLLPGESGTFDYARLLRLFYEGGYRGDVCCEVSSMVSSRQGYDPQAAARTCYQHLARAFEQARVPRSSS